MAEIKIEKKKTIWPYILLGIIVVAVIIYYATAKEDAVIVDDATNEQIINEDAE